MSCPPHSPLACSPARSRKSSPASPRSAWRATSAPGCDSCPSDLSLDDLAGRRLGRRGNRAAAQGRGVRRAGRRGARPEHRADHTRPGTACPSKVNLRFSPGIEFTRGFSMDAAAAANAFAPFAPPRASPISSDADGRRTSARSASMGAARRPCLPYPCVSRWPMPCAGSSSKPQRARHRGPRRAGGRAAVGVAVPPRRRRFPARRHRHPGDPRAGRDGPGGPGGEDAVIRTGGLTKIYGEVRAVDRHRPRRARGRRLRLPRRQRLRQDHDGADAARPGPGDVRRGGAVRPADAAGRPRRCCPQSAPSSRDRGPTRTCPGPRTSRSSTRLRPTGWRVALGAGAIGEVLEQVGLDPADKRPTKTYSLGMRQRLGLAAALMRRPPCSSSTSRPTGWTRRASATSASCCSG